MKQYWFKQAYIDSGWAFGVTVVVDGHGVIDTVRTNTLPQGAQIIEGLAIPGIPNSHCHAFQRAMAGLSEKISVTNDSFWSWRTTMYEFAHQMTPDNQRAIAAQLYMEMLKSGYTSVAEFHYLHHQPSGEPYEDSAELSISIIEAAQQAQINLTLLPVLYTSSDFGGIEPQPKQQMFVNTPAQYQKLLAGLLGRYGRLPGIGLGVAFHSLRAVSPGALTETLELLAHLDDSMPIHIHIAEQTAEVEASIRWSGQRPVDWLMSNHPVNSRWCLVHATHLSDQEARRIVESGATVSLCPTTEANLGDGFFPLMRYLELGGNIAIGSDSNISVSPIEELRWLEYGQRLLTRGRNLSATSDSPHTGTRLFDKVLEGGARALGTQAGKISHGCIADLLVLDSTSPHLYGKNMDDILNALVFSGNGNMVRDVMCRGEWVVQDFRHKNEEAITAAYLQALDRLQSGL